MFSVNTLKASFIAVSFFAMQSVQAITTEDVLEGGVEETVFDSDACVRRDVIEATLENVFLFDHLIGEPDSQSKTDKINAIIHDLKLLIPGLDTLKMFELFNLDEWIKWVPGKEGRILVGLLYLQENPESSNAKIMAALRNDYKISSSILQKEVTATLNKLDIPNE